MRNNIMHIQIAFCFGARIKFYLVSFKKNDYMDYKTYLSYIAFFKILVCIMFF